MVAYTTGRAPHDAGAQTGTFAFASEPMEGSQRPMDETPLSIQDVARRMVLARAELMTAKASKDQDVIHASLFQTLEEVIVGIQSITAELLKVEIEGLDKASF